MPTNLEPQVSPCRSQRGSSLLTVVMVAMLLLLLTTALLPSAQTEEAAGINTMVQEQLRMEAVSIPLLQSVRLMTKNDHRGAAMLFDRTPPTPTSAPGAGLRRALLDELSMEPPDLVSDLPCDLCGINNESTYNNNVPARNVVYQLEACSRRRMVDSRLDIGQYCVSVELNLLPWNHDGAAQAAALDQVSFK